AAILALELVAQEHVEPREGGIARRLDVGLERHDARQLHLEARRTDDALIFGEDIHAVEEDGLDRVLPSPQRQRKIAERAIIRVQDQRRTILRRSFGAQHGTAPAVKTRNLQERRKSRVSEGNCQPVKMRGEFTRFGVTERRRSAYGTTNFRVLV